MRLALWWLICTLLSSFLCSCVLCGNGGVWTRAHASGALGSADGASLWAQVSFSCLSDWSAGIWIDRDFPFVR